MNKLTVPEMHQLRIAHDTLKMSDYGVKLMGGMSKDEARKIVDEYISKRDEE